MDHGPYTSFRLFLRIGQGLMANDARYTTAVCRRLALIHLRLVDIFCDYTLSRVRNLVLPAEFFRRESPSLISLYILVVGWIALSCYLYFSGCPGTCFYRLFHLPPLVLIVVPCIRSSLGLRWTYPIVMLL